jgi:hypothetical protein
MLTVAQKPPWLWAGVYCSIAIMSIPGLITTAKAVAAPQNRMQSLNSTAFNYARNHPGMIYFPWHPLSVYLAEGHLYSYETGLFDRVAAGIQVDPKDFRRTLPSGMKYVAYKDILPPLTLKMLPEFDTQVSIAELPGWTVLARRPERLEQ